MDAIAQTFSHYPAIPLSLKIPLRVLPDHPCPYLPDRVARSRGFLVSQLPGNLYHDLMDAGFRRSGRLIYQPVCRGCRECRSIRVPVDRFELSRSQRRCLRRNTDLRISVALPVASDEKFALYRRYMSEWHGSSNESRMQFEAFLYDSPVQTLEFAYRDRSGRLLAVGICDVCADSLSSVYSYFDPACASRGLGTFGVISEIHHALRLRIPYYYLGYWIRGCRKMQYKSDFRPHEILGTDGSWRQG